MPACGLAGNGDICHLLFYRGKAQNGEDKLFDRQSWGEAFPEPAGKEKKPDHGADRGRNYYFPYLYGGHGDIPIQGSKAA